MSEPDDPILLADGTAVHVRPCQAEDEASLQALLDRLGKAGGPAGPTATTQVLVALRTVGAASRVVGAATRGLIEAGQSEAAVGVDPEYRGQGLATQLFERLALAAAHEGVERLVVQQGAGDAPLRDLLERLGFPMHVRPDGAIEIDLTLAPDAEARARADLRERVACAASLRPFFHPRSVAVVGASRDPKSLGYRTLQALVSNRFEGPVYAVNPQARHVGPFPAHASVRDLPRPVDMAVILVPRDKVLDAVDECAEAGVRALVVITAGFAETGTKGAALQEALLAKVRGHGMRMIGPNVMGILNADPAVRLNATFAALLPPAGNVAMSSQSGALGLAVLATAEEMGIGMSSFVSVGNKADVSGNDLLQYWEQDPRTEVILLYVESFGNPRRFARIARRVGRKKPIVAVKSGRTQAGQRAAGSHTAALAGSDTAADALFRQTGVIRADTLEEMFDLAIVAGSQPPPDGPRVAILTNAGGPGILCADACIAHGLEMAELSESLRARLAALLPVEASTGNPVDMIASAGPKQFGEATTLLLEANEVDALIVIHAPIEAADLEHVGVAVRNAAAAASARKPIVACLMGPGGRSQPRSLRQGLPTFAFPEAGARALGKWAAHAAWRRRPLVEPVVPEAFDGQGAREICREATSRGIAWLGPVAVQAVLERAGLPILAGHLATTRQAAEDAARQVGGPVAVKLVSTAFLHKTDVGGVVLGLEGAHEVGREFDRMRGDIVAREAKAFEGVLVQPMARPGVEVMAGMASDPLFGPVVAFGLGGVHVEALADVVFRVTPLGATDAAEMVRGIRAFKMLEGSRGHPPADLAAIEDVLLRLSALVEEVPEIREIDFNPLLAHAPGEGVTIVDARIRVAPTAAQP